MVAGLTISYHQQSHGRSFSRKGVTSSFSAISLNALYDFVSLFFDATSSPTEHTKIDCPRISPRAADLIGRINHHPRFLGVLGIVPNQLRTLLKETGHEHREEALTDISRTLFFAGYRVWSQRQKLASRYWKEIAPENRKDYVMKKRKNDQKTEQKELQTIVETCSIILKDIKTYQINVLQGAHAKM